MTKTKQSAQAMQNKISEISGDVRTIEAAADGMTLRTLVRISMELGPLEVYVTEAIQKEFQEFYEKILDLICTV